jgi:hypothetical protein
MKPKDDPTIARIRAARHRISQQFDHDPQKLVAHYIALQEEYRHRLRIQSAPEPTSSEVAGALSAVREEPSSYGAKEVDLLTLFQCED